MVSVSLSIFENQHGNKNSVESGKKQTNDNKEKNRHDK